MNVWDRIKDSLRDPVGDVPYRNWLEPVRFESSSSDGELRLIAPNKHVGGVLKMKFEDKILAAASSLGIPVRSVHVDAAEPKRLPVQGALPFEPEAPEFNPKFTFENFVVGSCNEFAHAASLAVAERGSVAHNPLYIYSTVGMGKTHLLHAIGHRLRASDADMKIVHVSAEEFANDMINSLKFNQMKDFQRRFRSADALLVDDVQALASKQRTQEEFFHTFNALHNSGKPIVLCCDSKPEAIPTLANRLKSRFGGGLQTDIRAPDLETKMAILEHKSDEAGVRLPEDVCSFIATRLHASIRNLEGILNLLVARSQFVNNRITIGMAKSLLGDHLPVVAAGHSLEAILETVAAQFELPPATLAERNNSRMVARPRQVAMYLCRRLTSASLAEIGKVFKKHHTTVLHGIEKIETSIQDDRDLESTIETLLGKLKSTPHFSHI